VRYCRDMVSYQPKRRNRGHKKMTNVISHMVPDGEGFAELDDYQLFLGHRRLDTVPKNAKQPLIYLNRYIITYNGEIYNYIKIKSE